MKIALIAAAVAAAMAAAAEEKKFEPAELLPRTARANGLDQVELAEQFQRYLYSVPAVLNPTLNADDTCGPGQQGPVHFLPPFPFSGSLAARTCTVPHDKHVFFVFTGSNQLFPCPDPTFHPVNGQGLEAFLRDTAIAANARVDPALFEVLVDGVPHPIDDHRITTPLYRLKADPSLSIPAFDTCIDGTAQPSLFDGWHFLIAPMSRGQHSVAFRVKSTGNIFFKTTLNVAGNEG